MDVLWFVIVAVFWTGFFVLEGFDFGVGVLHTRIGRRASLAAIGPFWDGNEVWLVIAGGATFAAFPAWYATMFSGLYLGLLLVLVALIARGVSLEFGHRVQSARWERVWTWATIAGSAAIPLVLGIGLGDLVAGLPIDADGEFTGNFLDIFTGYGVWTGITLVALCLLHGAAFLALKTSGGPRARALSLSTRLGVAALIATAVFAVWSLTVLALVAALAVLGTVLLLRAHRDGWGFITSAAAMAATVGSLFVDLYPNVMVSSTDAAYNLTVTDAASGSYALKVMTVVAVVLFPLVLLYQSWSYRVFRARVQDSA